MLLSGHSLLGNHCDGIDLDKVIRVRQCRHKQSTDDGWIRPLAPHCLKRLESSLERLSLDHIDVPLYDMFNCSPASHQGGFQVPEGLFRLRAQVTLAHKVARSIYCILAAN